MLDDLTPASIWVTNPNNICNGNRVAGSAGFGIWYRMHEHPEAGSFTKQICQQHEPLGEVIFWGLKPMLSTLLGKI